VLGGFAGNCICQAQLERVHVPEGMWEEISWKNWLNELEGISVGLTMTIAAA